MDDIRIRDDVTLPLYGFFFLSELDSMFHSILWDLNSELGGKMISTTICSLNWRESRMKYLILYSYYNHGRRLLRHSKLNIFSTFFSKK